LSRNLHGKRLKIIDVVGQSFSIGPLTDIGLFLGFVAATAGAVGPLAVLLATLAMAAFALVVAFFASETGGAGAIGDYIERAWGWRAGKGVLAIYTISLIVSGAGGFSIALGVLVSTLAQTYFGFAIPWWAGAMAAVLAAWLVNVLGAATSTRVQLVVIGVSVIPFLLTAVAAIIHAGPANTWTVFHPLNPERGDLFAALLFSILLFGGFETAASLGEETSNPRRNIPLALVGTVVASGLLFIFCSYAGTIYYGPSAVAKDWASQMDGFAGIADALLGSWAGLWVRIGILVDFASIGVGFALAASRGIFSLSRSGLLPPGLAVTNGRGAPARASTLVLVCALAAIGAGFLVAPAARYETLFVAATAQGLLLVSVYAGLALGALKMLFRAKQKWSLGRWVVVVLASTAPLLAFYGTVVPLPDFPERWGLLAALAVLVAAGLWVAWLPERKPGSAAG
jgi:amino acid transporter